MSKENELSKIYVSLIDLLFAVVLGQSFVIISDKNMLPSWIADPITSMPLIFNVLLVYTLIITSWVGYHKSVNKLPIRSVYRFITDIILLFLYYIAFKYVNSIVSLSIIFSLIFILYFIWNLLRYYVDYKEERTRWNLKTRTGQAFAFTFAFSGLAIAVYLFKHYFIRDFAAFGIFFLLILYRYIFRGGPKEN